MTMLALLVAAARAACPAPSSVIAADVDRAEAAFAALDLPGFEAARAALGQELGCLADSPTPALVARAHGVFAIAAVVAKDDAAASAALVSARAADPAYALPAAVPEGHRLRTMLAASPTPGAGTSPVTAPTGTRSLVDGREAAVRPTDRAAVVWLRDDAGRVPWSAFLPGDAPLPDLSGFAVLPPPPPPPPVAAPARRSLRLPLVVGTAVAAVGTGALFGVSQAAASRFADPATPWADLDGLRSRANALSVAGTLGLGATLGLGTVTLVAREAR